MAKKDEKEAGYPPGIENTDYAPAKPSFRAISEGRYQTIALIVVLLGLMMTAIDTTAVVLALPKMIFDLNSNILSLVWVIMSYLLVLTIFATQLGRLGDMYGRVRMFNFGFAIFVIGSLLCGLSQTGPEIIAFRIVQGCGGALIYSNSNAIIADTLPFNRRGRGFGITGMGYSIGAILGILVGGALITFLSWRYIFFINIPVGVTALVVSFLILRDKSPRIKNRIDIIGMGLLGAGLFLILYALTKMTGSGWSSEAGLELVGGGMLIAAFLAWEQHYSAPLLDLKLFRERVFTASVFAAFFQALANFAVLFFLIMYLQGVRGFSPFYSSLFLIPGYILGGATAPFAGRASDKYGARVIASMGLALQAFGVLVYYSLSLNSSLLIVIIGSVINGAGSSSFYPANISAVMSSTQQRAYGVASGLLRTFSNAGMVSSFAVALLMASLSISRQQAFEIFLGTKQLTAPLATSFVTGMHTALLTSVALTIFALILSILRGKEARTETARLTQSKH